MNDGRLHWWGFRIANPEIYDPEPPGKWEYILFGLVISCLLEMIWVILLTLIPFSVSMKIFGRIDFLIGISIILILVFPVLMLLVPKSIWKKTPLCGWMILTREDGNMAGFDLLMSFIAIISIIVIPFMIKDVRLAAMIFLSSTILVSALLFRSMKPGIVFRTKAWDFSRPDWLKLPEEHELPEGERGHEKENEEEIRPEPEANSIHALRLESRTYDIGIKISAEVLQKLRAINVEFKGKLYQQHPQAVVLSDRIPVLDIGREEVTKLCSQLALAGKVHNLSRLQLANAVLYFVQDAIDYAYDIDSTVDIPGGPYEEYGRFALETLTDRVGDCECTAILCAALLAGLGYEVGLIILNLHDPDTNQVSGHAAVGLKVTGILQAGLEGLDIIHDNNQNQYLYGETAIDGFNRSFGIIPPEWKNYIQVEEIYPIRPEVQQR